MASNLDLKFDRFAVFPAVIMVMQIRDDQIRDQHFSKKRRTMLNYIRERNVQLC